ncbi:cytoplasmic protein [Cryptococcus bacillisporus CA1873]|uniref:Cytoplasmic protein n=1 Tax=Cryptococcus bacillisporus CA1873 TaxID=1296111 RepID=A0ABR5BIY8_CRYGA|nr:cytoplasmic protein [Cryptococcus bacillisporus CA1873]|eukprot:KIR69125.1 cytoplasmic protein [Cryptococcus gattii CA1873]
MDLYTTSFTYPILQSNSHQSNGSPKISLSSPIPTTGPGPGSIIISANASGTSSTANNVLNNDIDPSTESAPKLPVTAAISATSTTAKPTSAVVASPPQVEKDWETVQKLALDITTREGCLVTVTRECVDGGSRSGPSELSTTNGGTPVPATTVWNFHLSGGYQPVMAARGAILRETPQDNRVTLKVPRSEILDSPAASVSSLKADVCRRLEKIALESKAQVSVISIEVSAGGGPTVLATTNGEGVRSTEVKSEAESKLTDAATDVADVKPNGEEESCVSSITTPYVTRSLGLETERMCELVITGSMESVEVAKICLLVMLDEMNGLHAESCDIDYKLHNIIAGRKRNVIQQIQEETATNIYFPTPLVGVLNSPQPGSQQGIGYRHVPMNMTSVGMQPTGPMTMQMTGAMSHGHSAPCPSLDMNPAGGGPMGLPRMNGNYHQQHNAHGRHATPVYNPHQHVQYPYQPQPVNIDPSTTRGMPYNGPRMHYPMHQGHIPMSLNHTGFQSIPGSRIGSPMPPHAPSPHPGMNQMNIHPHHSQPSFPHPQNLHPMQNPLVSNVQLGAFSIPNNINMGMGIDPAMGQFPGPHPGLSVHGGEQGMLGKSNQIWITGEFFGVQRARDMLLNIAMQKCKLVISRDTAILPRKLDWLLTQKIEDVKTIMNDNGTYIQVPSVGSQASLITVFGDHRVNIERTIRGIMALACQFYVASVWLLPVTFDVFMPQPTLNPAQLQPILKRIAHSSGAEVVFKSNCFEMHGLEQQVKAAVMMVLEQDIVHNFHREIRFQIELANEHRDFISGKKNGKINKIMKTANVKIKFETFNDYNFLIDISGTDGDALKGLSMLQEELPAEVSFHVPESYHKRIIGVSGKNIQKIMKLHGVYVKFSNAEEFAALGGYTDNEDNVVARTPAKNAVNLESLKQAVMELDKDYTVESVTIPRRYHRTLLGEKGIFIHDIETKTNSVFRFPYKETASDVVTIFGPESQVHIAAAMLLDHVPFEADLPVPPNPELSRLMTSADFILFTERIKRDHQIAIVPSPKLGLGNEAIFKFRCQRSNVDFLGTAIDALEDWLSQNKIHIYPKNANRRPECFTDAFSHFNSKLLSTKNSTELDGDSDRRIKQTAASVVATEDVRALFNGRGNSFGLGDESNLGLVSSLNYQDPRKGADRWPGSIPQQPPVTSRTESDHQKRDSDPIINDRIRQASTGHSSSLSTHLHPHSRPRISSNRHQSLDISQLNFSRALTGGPSAFGPMPPSPTAANSSPNTATAPYFPHVGPHPIRANVTGRGGYGSASSADVESVAQTMSNVQLSHQ